MSAVNKHVKCDAELPPLERTPQPNEESEDAEIHTAQKDLAIQQ